MTALFTPKVVFALGDSLTLGGTGAETHTWETLANQGSALYPRVALANHGRAGDTASGMATRWASYIKGGGHVGGSVWGYINDIVADSSAATIWAVAKPTLDDIVAQGIPLGIIITPPFGASVNWSSSRQTQKDALRALQLAYVGAAWILDLTLPFNVGSPGAPGSGLADPNAPLNLYAPASIGEGEHLGELGNVAVAALVAAKWAAIFPSSGAVVDPNAPNLFGVDADMVRRHYIPGVQALSATSAPTFATVSEKLTGQAARLAGKLRQKGIDPNTITDTSSAAYDWCADTLRLMVAVGLLQVITNLNPESAKAWKADLKERLDDLADNGAEALGGGASTTDLGGPDGPNTHIAELGLDTGDDSDASDVIPPFRKDDQL